jgi:hypothetical protein
MSGQTLMETEWALRRLALRYAHAADHHDGVEFGAIFTEDGVIEGPQFTQSGREQIEGNAAILKQMFASTLHTVLNQTVTVDGDAAEGETYCLAYHLHHPVDGVYQRLDWAIRYQDKYRRIDGEWKFTYRKLLIDWQTTVTVDGPIG